MPQAFTDVGASPNSSDNVDYNAAEAEDLYDFADLHPLGDLWDYAKEYAREKPEVAALWCFGIGFVLGWKLKPW